MKTVPTQTSHLAPNPIGSSSHNILTKKSWISLGPFIRSILAPSSQKWERIRLRLPKCRQMPLILLIDRRHCASRQEGVTEAGRVDRTISSVTTIFFRDVFILEGPIANSYCCWRIWRWRRITRRGPFALLFPFFFVVSAPEEGVFPFFRKAA